MQMWGFMLTRGENGRSAGWIRCKPWPRSEKDMLSFPSRTLRCGSRVCKAHSVISILKRKAWNITYSIRHKSSITPCQIEISSWNSIYFLQHGWWKTLRICILKKRRKFKNSLQIPFPFPQWLPDIFLLQFRHFLMQRYTRAALRGCESLPKPCSEGPFLSELHSQAAFNIHIIFSLM